MGLKMVVADDREVVRTGLASLLKGSDIEIVGEAANGVEAVEKYKELKPGLTTMDIVMPFKSGIEATKEILSSNKDAVVVMCSALGQESLVMEAIEAGAADFVVKPFKPEDVLRVVQKVLAGHAGA